ncbi:hypothetical protein EVAR_2368_1 [Eumeta japonica]|uniref:Uncharacterized protein n=1 Tax=Eumeta variegata TaxID=151549 RepID=A0A4C1SGI6_EUMVA|nr:hypothetical protein EVAR_2368_1 [Eumeta japonica]
MIHAGLRVLDVSTRATLFSHLPKHCLWLTPRRPRSSYIHDHVSVSYRVSIVPISAPARTLSPINMRNGTLLSEQINSYLGRDLTLRLRRAVASLKASRGGDGAVHGGLGRNIY